METPNKKKISLGLREEVKDPRDLKLGAFFKVAPLTDVPLIDFMVGQNIRMKNQKDSDLCTTFSGSTVNEKQEGVELSPEYLFMKGKQMAGNWQAWGLDLRTICRVLTKVGAIEQQESPFTLEKNGRDFVANPANWTTHILKLDELAKKHKKEAYFNVYDSKYDKFDSIRSALWTFKDEWRTIYTGCPWRSEWTYARDGVVPKEDFEKDYGHAFEICGQKMIAGVPYLVAQLSNGLDVGVSGYLYFPREIVNKEFYTAYMFKDLASITTPAIQGLLKVQAQQQLPWFRRLILLFKDLLK